MPPYLTETAAEGSLPITPLRAAGLEAWLAAQPEKTAAWVRSLGFEAKPGTACTIPGEDGSPALVLTGIGEGPAIWRLASLPAALPPRHYHLESTFSPDEATAACLGWTLATYSFDRYRTPTGRFATLAMPDGCDAAAVTRAQEAIFLVRDLINTPASDMGPAELAESAESLGHRFGARVTVLADEATLATSYPMIHAVGRASDRKPRLIDLRWGDESAPKVTLVGKGVCFDTGGLDLKTADGMRLMKKDMGGAAHVLGLASMIMAAELPVRLRVLIPAVENAVSGNAIRPGDVFRTRKGLTVEIGNTDAEGRLVLCDALADADGEGPGMIVDFATLTGAARVALGADLPAMFCNDDALAEDLRAASARVGDPLWRMPLYAEYKSQLESPVADLCNISAGRFGGAITAALYLEAFVSPSTPWVHFDIMAWNGKARPGRPSGGEAMALRAVYDMIAHRHPGRS